MITSCSFSFISLFASAILFFALFYIPQNVSAEAIHNKSKVDFAIREAANSLIDFLGVGDSNQIKDGGGWDDGFQYALSNKYGLYATGIVPVNDSVSGTGSGVGYTYGRFNVLTGATTSAPTQLTSYLDKGLGTLEPFYYGYLSSGQTNSNPEGLIMSSNNVIGNQNRLVGQYFYGTFDSGSGAFRPTVRVNQAPWTVIAQLSSISTNTGTYGMSEVDISLPADATRTATPLFFQWAQSSTNVVGPWFGLYQRVYTPDKTTGASYHTLYYKGGMSLRDMAYALQQASDTTLSYYFTQVRSLQGSSKKIIIEVNSGVNDRNDTNLSVGLNPIDSSTGAGYADNLQALIDRLKYIWALNGWATSELYFTVIPSHAVSYPDDAKLVSYRQSANTVSDNNDQVVVIDASQLCDGNCMTANSYYINTSDHNHLNLTGYEALSTMIVNALTADTSAPAVSLTTPSASAAVSGPSVALVASSTDDVGVVGVHFKLDGTTNIGSEIIATASPDTYTVTWNSASTTEGSHTLSAVARDAAGNYATSSSVTVMVQNTSVISSVATSSITSTSAHITWNTDLAASTQLLYGPSSSFGSQTTEADTTTRVSSHSVTLSSLTACTTYYFQAKSISAGLVTSTSSISSFTTTGCTGSASVATSSYSTITTSSGGILTQGVLSLTVPTAFTSTSSSATFQAHQLDSTSFFTSAGSPSGKTHVGTNIFNLKALTDATTTLPTFSQPLTVTLSYSPSDIVGLDELSLAIYRYDGSSWYPLSSCSVNTSAKTVTCSTSNFSDFALFGSPAVQTQAESTTSGGGGTSPVIFGLVSDGYGQFSRATTTDAQDKMIATLRAQLAALLALVAQLQGSIAEGTAKFTRNLAVGDTGSDVQALQQYLNAVGFTVATSGPGSAGKETTRFGAATRRALIRFQEAHADAILAPFSLKKGAGYFGASTRAFVNQ